MILKFWESEPDGTENLLIEVVADVVPRRGESVQIHKSGRLSVVDRVEYRPAPGPTVLRRLAVDVWLVPPSQWDEIQGDERRAGCNDCPCYRRAGVEG